MINIYVTDQNRRIEKVDLEKRVSTLNYITINKEITYQKFLGFGGAFTESSAYNLSRVSNDVRNDALKLYFGKDSLNYQLGRISMGGCDFSLSSYSYVSPNDKSLKSFNIDRDRLFVLPLIKDALKLNSNLRFLVSPWSPPYWMKDNQKYIEGGHLLRKYYDLYADYYVKSLKELEKENIDVFGITSQNEVEALQRWDSCLYTKEEESDFVINHLAPKLKKYNPSIKVFILDHNKDILVDRAKYIYNNDKNHLIAGSAVHWYDQERFEELKKHNELFKDRELIFTEGCIEHTPTYDNLNNGFRYARNIIKHLLGNVTMYIDWNLFLDEVGGPNWVNNLCDAPIIINVRENRIIKQMMYYAIGQFSKFIEPNSIRIEAISNIDLPMIAFIKNNKTTIVILNETDEDIHTNLKISSQEYFINIYKKSIITICEE